MTNRITVPINLNAVFDVQSTKGHTQKQIQEITISLIRECLASRLKCDRNGVSIRIKEGTIFNDEGDVQVGDLPFRVKHDSKQHSSQAEFNLSPAKDTFGHGLFSAEVGVSISPNVITVKASKHGNSDLETLAQFRVNGSAIEMMTKTKKREVFADRCYQVN